MLGRVLSWKNIKVDRHGLDVEKSLTTNSLVHDLKSWTSNLNHEKNVLQIFSTPTATIQMASIAIELQSSN